MSTEPMRLHSYNPVERAERTQHEQNQEMEFIINCWNCRKDFSVWLGWGNINASLFTCPHCTSKVEIE